MRHPLLTLHCYYSIQLFKMCRTYFDNYSKCAGECLSSEVTDYVIDECLL